MTFLNVGNGLIHCARWITILYRIMAEIPSRWPQMAGNRLSKYRLTPNENENSADPSASNQN